MTAVAEIRSRVTAGTYEVDPELVAEAILDRGALEVLPGNRDKISLVRALDYEGVPHERIAPRVGLSPTAVTRIVDEHVRPCIQLMRGSRA